MSEFNELIKSFAKSREYVRDFFVYGFKTRDDFKIRSARTYDNERRRLESWLNEYVKQDYTEKGKNIYLSIDSNLLDTNPLYRVWKAKSFTDNDIMLHFFILDYLKDSEPQTAEEITDAFLDMYNKVFDVQIVRRKCNEYVTEGLLAKTKDKKTVKYHIDISLNNIISNYPYLLDSLKLFQLISPMGFLGNTIMDNFSITNDIFRVKHSFFVHTLEDEILLDILEAIKEKRNIEINLKSTRSDNTLTLMCTPLSIFVSTRTGRRYLCYHCDTNQRFNCARLDAIKSVTHKEFCPDYDKYKELEISKRNKVWGASFQNTETNVTSHVKLTLYINEQYDEYILNRLYREGKSGTVTKIASNTFTYEKDVFDVNEMIPWIRTFIGRIIDIESDNQKLRTIIKHDLETMYKMYSEE